ncbi:rhomboid family intramembrane serine protease [Halopseudomonas nanhaiensis]|nr:rhomboid family intramembrane serine protease [Halopseudomonas nanhaiensis]
MYRAMQCPLDEDLRQLTRFLRSRGLVHRITEEGGRQVVWTVDEADAQVVRAVYEQGVPDVAEPAKPTPSMAPASGAMLRRIPLTLAILVVTGLVALWTGLGTRAETIIHLTFTPLAATGYLAPDLDFSQPWRVLSPIFLHFGLLHLTFNALWYWELGRRIELYSGSLWLLGLTVLFGLASNLAQWLVSPDAVFGGLSGVLYGLLGYCWIYQMLAPNVFFALPKGVVILMLVWLALGVSGLITLAGLGQIANAAHIGGLVSGCIAGAIAGALQRGR